MDLHSLFEISQHAVHNVPAILPVLHDAWAHTSDTARNVVAAITHEEAMPASERRFETGKLIAASAGCAFCLATLNLEGVVGFAIPEGEAISKLNKSGAQYRATHS
ncbi:MAG: hypothetical protein AAF988_06390 [Pseudomonadota bacterium]